MKTKKKTEENYGRDQAKAQLESIIEMVIELEKAENINNDEVRETIQEDPLSIQVRSSWADVGQKLEASEFMILLCTGGPAVRIVGKLDEHNIPERAWIEYQDWGTPWTEYVPSMVYPDNEKLLVYCQQFYFES